MRYYCKDCGTEISFEGGVSICFSGVLTTPEKHYDGLCPICDAEMEKITDYETPSQLKERTGKPYPDNGLVWAKRKDGSRGLCEISEWGVWFFERAVKNNLPHIVIADPPVPPPDNWRPE